MPFSVPYSATIQRYYKSKGRAYFTIHDIGLPMIAYSQMSENMYASLVLHILFQRVYELGYAQNDSLEASQRQNRQSVAFLIARSRRLENSIWVASFVIACALLSPIAVVGLPLIMGAFLVHNKRLISKTISFCVLMLLRYLQPVIFTITHVTWFPFDITLLLAVPFAMMRIENYFNLDVKYYSTILAITMVPVMMYTTSFKIGIISAAFLAYVIITRLRGQKN
jgi:hypothetical protein